MPSVTAKAQASQGCTYVEFRGCGHPDTDLQPTPTAGDIYMDTKKPRALWVYLGNVWVPWKSMSESEKVLHPTFQPPRILFPSAGRFAWVPASGIVGYKRQVRNRLLDGQGDTAHTYITNILMNEGHLEYPSPEPMDDESESLSGEIGGTRVEQYEGKDAKHSEEEDYEGNAATGSEGEDSEGNDAEGSVEKDSEGEDCSMQICSSESRENTADEMDITRDPDWEGSSDGLSDLSPLGSLIPLIAITTIDRQKGKASVILKMRQGNAAIANAVEGTAGQIITNTSFIFTNKRIPKSA